MHHDRETLPVFPLSRVVLFPDTLLPLHIFEPRYRQMIADCMKVGGEIIIAHVADGAMANVASIGLIVEHEPLADGRSNIIVAGAMRVRLDEVVPESPPHIPYLRAHTTALESLDVEVEDADFRAMLAAAHMFAAEIKKHDASFSVRLPVLSTQERASGATAGELADSCAFQLVVDSVARQAILEELDPRARVRMVVEQIASQHGAMMSHLPGPTLN